MILCVLCHYSCKTCTVAGASGCASCDNLVFRTAISANTCPCDDGYFDDSSNALC